MMALGIILTGIGTLMAMEINELIDDKDYKNRNKNTRTIRN